LINHLTEQGLVDPARFYESPYTDLSDQGISGVFPEADVQRIIAVVNDIRLKAVASTARFDHVPTRPARRGRADRLAASRRPLWQMGSAVCANQQGDLARRAR
jgi:hypothetical protein